MPTYQYECLTSGKRFERLQSMADEPLKKCPKCGGPARRLIGGGTAVIIKGLGSHAAAATRCGRGSPCCGREVPCDAPPCDE